jgi:hypothetical protein
MWLNIDKLKECYPECFDTERSIHRVKGGAYKNVSCN